MSVASIETTDSDICSVSFTSITVLHIMMHIRNDMLDLKKGNKFEFTFEEVDKNFDQYETLDAYDLCLFGTVYKITNDTTYVSNGGLILKINEILGPEGTMYLTKIKMI